MSHKKNRKALIILHEIYGINSFIKEQSQKYIAEGFDVFCPDLLGRSPFSYDEEKAAYEYFTQNIGFQVFEEVNDLIIKLKEDHDQVFLLGFSVGATLAWCCCENMLCSGIVACYGSRIRDYIGLCPACPTILLFADNDSFNVSEVVNRLKETPDVSLTVWDAPHGFMDPYSSHYNQAASEAAGKVIDGFLKQKDRG